MAALLVLVRVPYRTTPGPNNTVLFSPFIHVRIERRGAPTTRPFEALVDSGASDCIFHADFAAAIGLDLESGTKQATVGVGGSQDVWVHPVVLYAGDHALNIKAAFAANLPIAGLLGRAGFFEHFKITFDPTNNPPGLELERVYKI